MPYNYALRFGNAVKIGVTHGRDVAVRSIEHQRIANIGAVIYGLPAVKGELLWIKQGLDEFDRNALERWMKEKLKKNRTKAGAEWIYATPDVLKFISDDPFRLWQDEI